MQIKVRFFASLAEIVDCRETDLNVEGDHTVLSIWKAAAGNAVIPDGTLCAVNRLHCEFDRPILNNDEVAFFPPMTGG